ncbi:MAG: EF-hand domain-containing protein [Syntrophorhabdaceae bacterium]|nr:EF-hand domain-containing protein [Syntrophorhabdaceae bacterium]
MINGRIFIIALLAIPFLFTLYTPSCFSQLNNNKARENGRKDDSTKPEVRIRAKTKGDFKGTVIAVDAGGKTISLKNRGIIVTFDIANPVLKGYRDVEQIKIGDTLFISYYANGTIITKEGRSDVKDKEPPTIVNGKRVSEPSIDGKRVKAAYQGQRPVRITARTGSYEFRDVDNNGDGRITPAELSAIVSDLTIETFRGYDKNRDNVLNEDEYKELKRQLLRKRD